MNAEVTSQDEAERIIGPHMEDLGKLFAVAWSSWKSLPPDVVARRTRRTRAMWLHDDLSEEARRLFESKPGVHVSERRGFLTLTFENKIVMRFKKFRSGSLRTSGVMTVQRMEFESQQLTLPGLGPVTTTVAGYLLDSLEREFKRLAIVCPLNGDNVWEIDIPIPGTGGQTVPLAPNSPVTSPVVDVRSIRDTGADQKEG